MNLGVIIGRFQCPRLHDGHKKLIQSVQQSHDQVLVLVGCTALTGTKRNPLDYVTREMMLREAFPGVAVAPLFDMESDAAWSRQVDRIVRGLAPVGPVTLFGSRDSFLPYYKGAFKAVEVSPGFSLSGTDSRAATEARALATEDFRAGVVYGLGNQYPRVFLTVDVAAIVEKDGAPHVAMGLRAEGHRGWRFPGGFVDQGDATLEAAAERELKEELALRPAGALRYVGSFHVKDWRYLHKDDGYVKTVLFQCAAAPPGIPSPGDDMDGGAGLVSLRPESLADVWPPHQPLFTALLTTQHQKGQ